MGKTKELCQAESGLFVRNLGKKITPAGKLSQHKSYLGRDAKKAKAASDRLELLWEHTCDRWKRENPNTLEPTSEPFWDSVSLEVADAIRNGEVIARVHPPEWMESTVSECTWIGEWLHQVQEDFPFIRIELANSEKNTRAPETLRLTGERMQAMGRQVRRRQGKGDALHGAFNAYNTWMVVKYVGLDGKPTPWSGTQERQINFLKACLPNDPLSDLDAHRIEELIDVLRLRPIGKKGRISRDFAQNCIKRFRHFLRWLSRSNEFEWKRPADLDLPRVNIPMTSSPRRRQATRPPCRSYARSSTQIQNSAKRSATSIDS